ncbi:helix-turn-helix domain-containing protein [Streptomyces carminius]|nr:helix-turn-helix transcriptional regulator [Streptomyces carminius]
MSASENPIFLRQRLRDRLKRAREAADLTQQQVADSFGWSPSKVIRIENGKIGVSVTDAMALLGKYGIAGEEADQLIALAKAARQPTWYSGYRQIISPEFQAYLAYEESASIVRNFARNVIPGLMQTEEYARTLLRGFNEGEGAEKGDLEMRVELRMRRQRVLESDSAQFFFVLDEAALRRFVGGDTVMRQQYEALLRTNELPNVKVMYVPFTAGIYPLFRTPYQVFEFPSDNDDLVAYLETPEGEVLLSEKTPRAGRRLQPADYLDTFWKVEKTVAVEITEEILLGK